ncbi:MAG: hypothetical protein K2Q18_02790 [Bdellovibrionales bacterium]|nr:hypothetical protein [Bdellovibrionales bacterium]
MKVWSFLFFISVIQVCHSFEVDNIDITNHPQSSFPIIKVTIGEKTVDYYGGDSAQGEMKFEKAENLKLEGEIPLSGYIFAKEFVESFRITKTIANKKTKSEFVKIFSEENPGKLVDFLLTVNEKKRNAESDSEIKLLTKKIAEANTEDIPTSTPYFSTGYIELRSPKGNNERYFVKISDVNKATMKLNPDKTKINMLKAITIYSFQNTLSSLNFGDIEKGSVEDQLYNDLERTNLSLCNVDCPFASLKSIGSMAMNVGKIVSFEAQANDKIENFDDFNKYVLAQQWCLLNEFNNSCKNQDIEVELQKLAGSKILSDLLIKHKTKEDLCKFLQK